MPTCLYNRRVDEDCGARACAIHGTASADPYGRRLGAVEGYSDGITYGRKCARTMSPARRDDNLRMVQASPYYQRESVTRAYWLGFVRAMREEK